MPEIAGTCADFIRSFHFFNYLPIRRPASRPRSRADHQDVEKLRADYVPGDLGFDPLGLKPEDPAEFREMQTKELQNGRLAMIAVAGFFLQELVNGKGIIENFSS